MTRGEQEALAAGIVDTVKRAIAPLDARIAQLEAAPFLKNGGIWRHGSVYSPGDCVQFKGSRWVCTKGHTASGEPDHACFQLWEKR